MFKKIMTTTTTTPTKTTTTITCQRSSNDVQIKRPTGNWFTRKCFHAAYYYLDDPPHHPNIPQVDWEVPIEVGGEIRAAVPVNEFAKHVASLHADGDIGFSREYEAIQNECVTEDLPCEHSQHPENKRKNRYLNITAYDHSRVHLHPTPGQKKNLDYINANFIDGYQKSRAFIGTQGPLPDTFDCFWRMIWEQRVAIIVMITNLVERGRRKCDMYWPKDGFETYGVIQVKLIEEEVMAMYIVRTFQIKHLKLKKKKQTSSEKIVYQYHYTNWPDHGTPDHPLPVLNFVKKSSAANPADAGPIVVHCSAGVGRTGTYIVLDAMLKQIQHKGVVNVFGFLRHIRIQRNFLVQTEEQYIFIHDALVEAIASSETNLRADQIDELKNCTPYLEQQYRNIIQFQTKDIHIASAMKQVNSIKNRGAIFPIECSRVHLTPKPGEEGSDYINASWLHGFRRLRDFIATQHPMTHTVKDFWQMVWDHNAQTIVLLSSLDEINFAQFWPDDSTPIESNYYRVRFLSKTNKSDYVSRDFVIQSIQDDYELNVKMLHCPSWPDMSNPNSIYNFIVDVHERSNDYRNGPIVVVDRYGGAQACTFCAISSLAIEMEYCQMANIYQYAKLYHNKRPGVWTSSEDIRLIYNILAMLPPNLQLLKRTAIKTEIEDVTTATPDLYSKICNNGNNETQSQQQQQQHQLEQFEQLEQNQHQHAHQQQQLQQESNQQQPHIQKRNSCCIQNSNSNHVEINLTIPTNLPLSSTSISPSSSPPPPSPPPPLESSQSQSTSSPPAQNEHTLAVMQQQQQQQQLYEYEYEQQAPPSHQYLPSLSQSSSPQPPPSSLQYPSNNSKACPPPTNSATTPSTTTSSSSTSSLQLLSSTTPPTTTSTTTTANDCKQQQQQQTQVVIPQTINHSTPTTTTTTTRTLSASTLSPSSTCTNNNNYCSQANSYSSSTTSISPLFSNNTINNDHITNTNNEIFHNFPSSTNQINATTTTNMDNVYTTTTTITTLTTMITTVTTTITPTTTATDPLSIFPTHLSSLNDHMATPNYIGISQQQPPQPLSQPSPFMHYNIPTDTSCMDNQYSIYPLTTTITATTFATLPTSPILDDYNMNGVINNYPANNAQLNNINAATPSIGIHTTYNSVAIASTTDVHNLTAISNGMNIINPLITTTTTTTIDPPTTPSTLTQQHDYNNYIINHVSTQTPIHTRNHNNVNDNANDDNNHFYISNNGLHNNPEIVTDAQSLDIVG